MFSLVFLYPMCYNTVRRPGGVKMKTKNICKFTSEPTFEKIDTHCFIYETNVPSMQKSTILEHHRMILVKNGEFMLHVDKMQFKVSTGSLVFAFAGESLRTTAAKGDEYLYIDFSGNRSDILFRRLGIHIGNRCFEGFNNLIPFWEDSLIRASHENLDLATEGVLFHSLSKIKSPHNKQNTIIQQIIDKTEESFNDPELSISTIAQELAYNEKYLSHLFKQKMGVGYTEYLRMYRINYAIMLLDNGIDSVKNIASLCGFSNPMYFSSVFKQAVGVSPSKYTSNQINK